MKPRFYLIILAVWLWPAFMFSQNVKIGDILCTDGSTVSAADFPSSGRTAEGIVFYVNENGHGWAVSLECQAVSTHWVASDHYYEMFDIPGLDNFEYSRAAIYDLDGYSNTEIIRNAHGADWYPAAWSVDFNNGWYLPAAGQLRWLMAYINEVNNSLAAVQGTLFIFDHPRWYWTSTERGPAHAIVVSQTGSVANYPKWNYIGQYEIGVRAVKSFTVQAQPPTIGEVVTAPDGQQGVVFYVSPDDDSYWLAAMDDLSSDYQWGLANDLPDLDNFNENNQYVTLHGVHCGYDATRHMREAMGTSTQYASSHVDLDHGWHIPSAGQLSKLFAALPFIETVFTNNGGTSLNSDSYWTSTECSSDKAWTLSFGPTSYTAGILVAHDKSASYAVRPVWSQSCEIPLPEPTIPDNIIESDCNLPLEGFEWGIREEWASSDNIYCRINPLVGDLDDDGIPEIVCFDMEGNSASQTAAKTMNVYDGRSKALKAQITVEGMVWAHGNGPFGLVKLPNRKGLIVTACKDRKLYAYDIAAANPNNPVWVSNETYNTGNNDFSVSIGFADFNGDGFPEIYVRNKIFDAETGIHLATAQGGNNQADSYSHNSHTNHNKLSCPIAFDICGDTRQELVLGNEIYDVVIANRNGTAGNHATLTKSITPPDNIIADGHVQVADFNLDGHPDLLISNRDTEGSTGTVSFYVWDVFSDRTSSPIKLSTTFTGKSIPLIADFDNDGFLEILIDCCHESDKGLRAYRFGPNSNSFSLLWSLFINEDSYSNTATLFDFNNDGKNELVFSDNSHLRIYDVSGTQPVQLSTIDCGQISIMHVPIVVDCDNDGSAEIIVMGKTGGELQANTMLKIFKSATDPWRAARKVWNQYMYHVTNVNEDLTIPTFCFNTATVFTDHNNTEHRPYNNFLQQAYYITPEGIPYNPSGTIEVSISGSGCESYAFHGITYTESGHYEQLVESETGCDTLYQIEVSIGGTVTHEIWQAQCNHFTWNDETYYESGDYQQSFISPLGCDSIVTLHLSIIGPLSHEWSMEVCDRYTWNGTTYSEPGDYTQDFVTQQGCDSIVTLHLAFSDVLEVDTDTVACGSLWWNGQEYTESGHYEQQFVTPGGCDSLVRMDLSVLPFPDTVPEIVGLQEVYVSTDIILGQYNYFIDSVEFATHYEWILEGPEWIMDTTGTQCSLWITLPGTATLKARAWNGCGYTEQQIIIHAGFFDVDDNPTLPFAVYPNPAHDIVFIEAEGIICVRVFDLLGQCLAERLTEPCECMELSLQDYAASIYLIEVQTQRGTIRTKLKINPE